MTWTIRRRSRPGPLAAIIAGEGPQILLIHGVGLRAEAWNAQIDALARDFRVLAVDLPGHGLSASLPPACGLADFTQAVADCLDGPVVVAGHSFGAMIALDLAITHPGKVIGVAALNAIYRRDETARAAVLARADSLDGVRAADPSPPLDRWFGPESSATRDACRDWLLGVDQAAYRNAYTVFATRDGPSDEALADLACPALFMTGANEPNSTPRMSQAMAARAADGRAMIVAQAAHMMPMTHSPAVNAALGAFARDCQP